MNLTTFRATRHPACRARVAHEPAAPALPAPPAGAADRFLTSSNDCETSCSNRPNLVPRRARPDAGVGCGSCCSSTTPTVAGGAAVAVGASAVGAGIGGAVASAPSVPGLRVERARLEEEVVLRGRSVASSGYTKGGSPASSSAEPKTGVKSVCGCCRLWSRR